MHIFALFMVKFICVRLLIFFINPCHDICGLWLFLLNGYNQQFEGRLIANAHALKVDFDEENYESCDDELKTCVQSDVCFLAHQLSTCTSQHTLVNVNKFYHIKRIR